MFAPFTRSMTFTLGLFSLALSPDSLADTTPETAPTQALELGATTISADGLGSTTEHTGAYTTGSMSTATRLNLSVKETPQSISVVTRQQMDDFNLNTLTEVVAPDHGASTFSITTPIVSTTPPEAMASTTSRLTACSTPSAT